jgi:murein DD-endopeptidase MepM/ murein hydrolase activator NlpD
LLKLPARLFAKLRLRYSAQTKTGISRFVPSILALRRTSSAMLVVLGGVMIAVALASEDGSAMQEAALPPAAPVLRLGSGAATGALPSVPNNPPAQAAAPSTQGLDNPSGQRIVVDVTRSYPFVWPADGPITSEMGPWHTLGIDIGLDYGVDSPILASARGTVEFAGGEDWEDYGHHVLIDHGGGMKTLYGHLYEVFVKEGDVVEQGALLGYGGDTGHAEGKHLHFEVRHDKALIDPQDVLPPHDDAEAPEPLTADCGAEAIIVDSGAPLVIDFAETLGAGASLEEVTVDKVKVSPQALPVVATLESDTAVLFDSTPTVVGTGDDDEYKLTVMAGDGTGEEELACTILVRTRTIAPSYYVRPTNTPTPPPPTDTPIPPTATNTPTPTPTPTPTKTPFPAGR